MVNYNPVLLPNPETFYRASRFSETFTLLGYPVKITPCLSYELNAQGDPHNMQYGEEVNTFIAINELSKVSLEKRGWITEETPIVADISEIKFAQYVEWRDTMDSDMTKIEHFLLPIRRYSIIKIPYKLQTLGESIYTIMDIYGDDTRPLVWECRLAPVRNMTDAKPETIEPDQYREKQVGLVGMLNEAGDDSAKLEDFK